MERIGKILLYGGCAITGVGIGLLCTGLVILLR
jgi:hypothetical protein